MYSRNAALFIIFALASLMYWSIFQLGYPSQCGNTILKITVVFNAGFFFLGVTAERRCIQIDSETEVRYTKRRAECAARSARSAFLPSQAIALPIPRTILASRYSFNVQKNTSSSWHLQQKHTSRDQQDSLFIQ